MANLTAGLGLRVALESYGYAHVSHGTLHPADLAEAMYSAVNAYAEPNAELTAWNKEIMESVPASAWEDRNHQYWDSEEAQWILEDMAGALDSICPEGYYFGSTEGDASDFAIWKDAEEEAV